MNKDNYVEWLRNTSESEYRKAHEGRWPAILTPEEIKANRLYRGTHKCDGFEGPCKRMDAIYYRQNTNYVEESDNWTWLCSDCQSAYNEYWNEVWDDFYGTRW